MRILTVSLLVLTIKGRVKASNPHVQTSTGVVIGEYKKTILNEIRYASYRGIPYAEPPLRSLRFRPPVPKEPWRDAALHAVRDAPKCIQQDRSTNNIEGVEDCLYLNIYVPMVENKNESKAVIVWIHGGAFTTGTGNSTYYGPDFLLEKSVIVASIQYRLGPFGFLNLNHANATGNAGLKDQNLALKWIYENIANFDGDEEKITLMGQSAGGVSVDLHKISDMSAGLFTRTISMSASPLCLYWAFQTNTEANIQASMLGEKLNITTKNKDDLLQALLEIPAEKIIEKANELPLIPFRPTLENSAIAKNEQKFLTECTPKIYSDGRYNKGEHMMGFTKDEILFLAKSLDELINYMVMASKFIEPHVPLQKMPFTSKVLSFSTAAIGNLTKHEIQLLISELSDLYFVVGIDKKQRLLSESYDYPIFYYHYTFKANYSAHRSDGINYLDGVAHEDELPHIFYRPHINIPLKDKRISSMRERLVEMWTNFAKYGHPTPRSEEDSVLRVKWPDSREEGRCLEINDNLTVEKRPTDYKIEFYEKIGLADFKILNDCVKQDFVDRVRHIISLPRTIIKSEQ